MSSVTHAPFTDTESGDAAPVRPVGRPVVLLAEELSPATVDVLGGEVDVRHVDGTDRGALLAALSAEHGVMDAVAFETPVAQDLPGLHTGEGVLDAGANLFVRPVVFLFPGREFDLPGRSPVRDHQSGALVAAIGDRRGGAHGGLGAAFLPAAGVMAVAGQRSADHDDHAGDGVDYDLMGSRVAIIFGLCGASSSAARATSAGPRMSIRIARSARWPAASFSGLIPGDSESPGRPTESMMRRHSSQAARKPSYA
ncbi:hypothetical protein SALBM311S_04958 [Streptomyces alboniger]